MLSKSIIVVTIVNFICASIGWGIINSKKKDGKAADLTDKEKSARNMIIANFSFSLVAVGLAVVCLLAEDNGVLSNIDFIKNYGKWAVLACIVISLGLSTGALIQIESSEYVNEGYIKHSRNSMLANVILGLVGGLFVFDKVPAIISAEGITFDSMFNNFKSMFSSGAAAAEPVVAQ